MTTRECINELEEIRQSLDNLADWQPTKTLTERVKSIAANIQKIKEELTFNRKQGF